MGLERKSPVNTMSEVDEESGRKSGEETPKTRRRNGSSSGGGSGSGKNGKSRKLGGWRLRPLLTLAACTMVFGPMGTFLTFMLLPDDHVWRLRQTQARLPPLHASAACLRCMPPLHASACACSLTAHCTHRSPQP